jgi:probable RNA-binding protein EIF1AD
MSKATKKRFVTKKLESELVLPKEDESIARVVASVGRDLHEVIDAEGEKYLVSMPPRFRTTVYIRRGHFVYLTRIDEGDKVKGEITHVLDNETICYCMGELNFRCG